MKLSDVIKIWEILHVNDVGEIGFCDLEKAIGGVVGVENDIAGCQSTAVEIKGTITIPPSEEAKHD